MMMPRQELLKELEIREKELMDELNAIRFIMGHSNTNSIKDNPTASTEKVEKSGTSVTPKGEQNWGTYVLKVLNEIGGRGKTRNVSDAIIKANPELDKITILRAVRHHLSQMYRDKVIEATKGAIQSEGYEYNVKQ